MRFELDLTRPCGPHAPAIPRHAVVSDSSARASTAARGSSPAGSSLALRLHLGSGNAALRDTHAAMHLSSPAAMRALPVLRTEVPVPAPAHAPAGGAFREPLDSDVTAQWLHLPRPAQGLFVVPVGTRIAGDCRARHVWVRGEVTGRVTATEGLLVVDLGARVLGGVEGSGSVVIAGSVAAGHAEHAVIARGRLDLACTAIIHGSVQHGLVTIYEGAAVDGEFVGLEK